MRRREFIAGLTGAAVVGPRDASSQPQRKRVVGFLTSASKSSSERYTVGFTQRMNDLGRVAGRDYVFETRYADGEVSRLSSLAKELIELNPSVIVTGVTAAALAAKQTTNTIPIIGVNLTDPIGFGLVASEAHPGANVTGILIRIAGLSGKQLEIATDLVPGAKIGLLIDANNPSNAVQRREVEAAAKQAALVLIPRCELPMTLVLHSRHSHGTGPTL